MNESIINFARTQILAGLLQLPEQHQKFFSNMYRGELPKDSTIQKVVAALPSGKLDWALRQVENTHTKLRRELNKKG